MGCWRLWDAGGCEMLEAVGGCWLWEAVGCGMLEAEWCGLHLEQPYRSMCWWNL